jgi:enoyl-CoA hydratase
MQNDAGALSLAKQSINAGLCSDLSSGLKLESSLFGLAFAANEQHQGLQAFLKRNKMKKHIEP